MVHCTMRFLSVDKRCSHSPTSGFLRRRFCVASPKQCCSAQYFSDGVGACCRAQRKYCSFSPGMQNMRYGYAFSSASNHRRGWLRARHRSCGDGLFLAVESCIAGRRQYKRTNTVRQIIEMKGMT